MKEVEEEGKRQRERNGGGRRKRDKEIGEREGIGRSGGRNV